MNICHIVPSLAERHGGPSKSVRALANHLVTPGHEVSLLATCVRGDVLPLEDNRAAMKVFFRVTPKWLVRSPDLRRHLLANPVDCIHHHSLWLLSLRYAAEAARRHAAPLVISPRGMMSGWAYAHREWRKQLASWFVHPGAFRRAAGWHATSPEEADDIRKLGFTQPVCVSPNGVDVPDEKALAAARAAWLELCPAARSRPVALFYSRLHRKKRVKELIDLWLGAPRGDWLLVVAGMAEDYSAAGLTAELAARNASGQVQVFDSTRQPHPYAIASLFVLPSHSENFGLVIAEALAAGVPALVTDTTPWTGLGPQGCGWCVSWEGYGDALATALATPSPDLQAMGRRGVAWMQRDFSWSRSAALLREFYLHLIDEQR
ncbi:MAG TPA: glycosyltransferase [Lacunisphaera sp.]|nr:glycosyltransferase [Lacunisphaera sp.]